MASYFDHFMITKVFFSYLTDSLFILIFVIMLWMIMSNNQFIIPSRIQTIMEMMMEHWIIVMKENLGEKTNYYMYPLTSLFMFILGVNLLGFFIYTLPSTTHITLTFGMAISIWVSMISLGLFFHKTSFFSMFMPTGAPMIMSPLLVLIEMVSNMSSPIALGMRLAANLTAGHILLAILADFGCKLLLYSFSLMNLFPIFMMMFMTSLEMAVLMIQAYVFCLLSMIYLKDSLILH